MYWESYHGGAYVRCVYALELCVILGVSDIENFGMGKHPTFMAICSSAIFLLITKRQPIQFSMINSLQIHAAIHYSLNREGGDAYSWTGKKILRKVVSCHFIHKRNTMFLKSSLRISTLPDWSQRHPLGSKWCLSIAEKGTCNRWDPSRFNAVVEMEVVPSNLKMSSQQITMAELGSGYPIEGK